MSKIYNINGFQAGSIYRIALENFVTYKEVELYPGPSLNLIIGPNGTGKSTFVCAIILGLCGKTTVIGRSKKISDYVRSGCDQASIEIELYKGAGERNVIITRTFNMEGTTTWSIDHKNARERQVQDLIASLNIQVDNLCQLLPQDRVQDFSKMDPQQLLRSTLSAVGGQQSVTQLDELIQLRNEQKNLSTKLTNNSQTLEEQIRLNERLQVVINAMHQRKQLETEIEITEKKKLWIEYQELRTKVVEYTTDKKEAVTLVGSLKNKINPYEKKLEKVRSSISKLEQQKLTANRDMLNLKDKVKESIESVKTHGYRLNDLETEFQEKIEHHNNRQREIGEAKLKLDKLVIDRDKLVETVGDDEKVKMDLVQVQKPIAQTNASIEALKKKKLEIQYDLENNIVPQIRLFHNKIKQLQDVGNKRLEVLRSFSEDCYEAVMWYRQNKQLFHRKVYEPMVLEINFTDAKFARYLESTIANRDLVAFTFESSEDMNLFLRKVRGERGLRQVNAICSQSSNSVFQPPCPIEELSYLGFYTYLVDTITAPDAITRYLCKQYGIHRIPIGNDHTYRSSSKVPANINYFFTENHRFTCRVSAYSGARSSSTAELRPPRLLANTLRLPQLRAFAQQLSKFENTAESHREKMQGCDTNLASLEERLNDLYTRRKKIAEGVDQIKTISAQIRLQTKKLDDIRNEPAFNIEQERGKCRRKQKEIVLKQCQIQKEVMNHMKSIKEKLFHGELCKVKLEISRGAIVDQESELRELKNELRSVEATLENIDNLLTSARVKAKEKLVEAKQGCHNKLPQDPDFPYKREFDELPASLRELQQHCCELQARLQCMASGDDQVIKEYDEREKVIQRLKNEVSNSSSMNKILEERMAQIRSVWLPPLEELLNKINSKFGEMFAKMNCAGEVKLDKAGDEYEEYEKYGASVLVRFRSSQQLQPLSRHSQSGGERALSTALYLLALQGLAAAAATAPFRCVDEINQGMDPINERKMFQLLVKVTTECNISQYFLLTPKLLSKLEYNDKIMVHTIMNGKRILDYRQWKYSQFLRHAKDYDA